MKHNVSRLFILLLVFSLSGCLTVGTLTRTKTLDPMKLGGGVYFCYPHIMMGQMRMGLIKNLEMGAKISATGMGAVDFKVALGKRMAVDVLAAFFDSDSKLFEFNAIFAPRGENARVYYGIGAVIPDMHGTANLGGMGSTSITNTNPGAKFFLGFTPRLSAKMSLYIEGAVITSGLPSVSIGIAHKL